MTCDIMMMIRVSGMLRKMLIQAVPNPRISGTGLTRIAASSTPRMNDPIADQKVSWMVIQKAPRTLYLGSDRKLKSTRPTSRSRNRPACCPASVDQSVRYDCTTDGNGPRACVPGGRSPISSAAGGRRGRDLEVGRSDGVLQGLLPAAVGDHRGDGGVDLGGARGVALLQADAVVLGREALADNLELTRVLRGVAGQDDVVGGDRIDGAGPQRLDALGVGAVLLQRHVRRVVVLDLLGRGGAGHRAEDLAGHRGRAGDVGVVGLDQQVLRRDEVRAGKVDLLLAGVGDRVRRDDVVDLAALDQSLTLGGLGFLELDAVRGDA